MISKELLSEVLENEVVKFKIVTTKRITQIRIWYKDTEWHMYESWDIYHLAHKCKEYLLDEGYYIVIRPFKVELFEKDTNSFIRDFHYPIQDKAIPYDIKRVIQACQWILDNKEIK